MIPLNGILAFGALAFTIPLVIHLFFRSKFRTLPWGAMHLLDSVVRINRRRIQVLNVLLLLLRCLVPILLAWALARPVLTGFRALPGDAPRSVILAIDDSRSMKIAGADGRTRWQIARDAANTLLDSLSRRDEVMIVRPSQRGELVGTMSLDDARRTIASMGTRRDPIDGASVDLGRLIHAAMAAARDSSHAPKQIVVISDFQTHELDEPTLKTLSQTGQTLENDPLRPSIRLLSVADASSHQAIGNLSVTRIWTDSAAVVAGRKTRLNVQIDNQSDRDIGDVRLLWEIAGKAQRPHRIHVSAKASTVSRLTIAIDEVGIQPVSVTIEYADALAADNQRVIGLDVIKEVRVLIVDGKPSREPFQGEADFLAIALSPFAFGGEDQPDAVRSEVVHVNQLTSHLDDQPYDVVILAGVPRLNDTHKRAIAQFISRGGNLMIFAAPKLDTDSFSGTWGDSKFGYQLPSSYSSLVGRFEDNGPGLTTEFFPVGKRNAAYSPWDLLGDAEEDLFGDVEIAGYYELIASNGHDESSPNSETSSDAPVNSEAQRTGNFAANRLTLLSFVNSDPLVISGRAISVGEAPPASGSIIQFAIPANLNGSSLPLRPLFLPMMQQLILDLAGSQRPTTYEVGQPFSIALREVAGDRTAKQLEGDSFHLHWPEWDDPTLAQANKIVPMQPMGLDPDAKGSVYSAHLPVPPTTRRGVYRLVRKSANDENNTDDSGASFQEQTLRVVDVPPIESDARVNSADRLASAAERIGGKAYSEIASLLDNDQTDRFGREIWQWVLAALLVVMVGELFLQQKLTNPTKQPVVKADVGDWNNGATV